MKTTTETLPLAKRITQGPVKKHRAEGLSRAPQSWGLRYEITSPELFVGFTLERSDAELIAEAFNVTHETGKTPRQLADENAELKRSLSTMTALARLKFGNLDADVYAEIQKAYNLLSNP